MDREPPLRVRIVCHDLGRGGAARATARLVEAIHARQDALGLNLSVRSANGPSHPLAPAQPLPGGAARAVRYASNFLRHRMDLLPSTTANDMLHSRADVWTGLGRETNRLPLDVVNLHWMGTGTMSIGEVGRLRHPVVLTLHDMWAFSGSAHYSEGARYRAGATKADRLPAESGVDWDRLTWRRKQRQWRDPMQVIAPSNWLASCARSSALMQDWPVTVIPHPIDTDAWAPIARDVARAELGLPVGSTLVLFGADGGTLQRVKGRDLLEDALHRLPAHLSPDSPMHQDVRLVVFGGELRSTEPVGRLPFPVEHLGRLEDDRLLRMAYSASDVLVVPSRLEAFGLVALEGQACGVPVVTFADSGPADIVEDGVTGRLAAATDVEELARAIAWVTEDEQRSRALGAAGRARAIRSNGPDVVAAAYADVYRSAAGRVA
jgi:glycosyltransferase involved in cell wall biosynthesis